MAAGAGAVTGTAASTDKEYPPAFPRSIVPLRSNGHHGPSPAGLLRAHEGHGVLLGPRSRNPSGT
jgi:hypothetical protein